MRDLWGRLLHAISFGTLTYVDDSKEMQSVQVREKMLGPDGKPLVTTDVPHVAHFGFTSNPPLDSEVLLLRPLGSRSHGVAVATSHKPSRLKGLAPGDAALYDVRGAHIWLTSRGLVIDCAGLPAKVRNVSTLTVEGDIRCTGEVTAKCDTAPVALSTHQHVLMGPSAPKTGVPIPD